MNRILVNRFLLFVLLASAVVVQGQSTVKMENTDESTSDYSASRSVVKLNPLLFFRGDIPIYYERSISDKTAVELGVGFTLKDYFNYNYLTQDYTYEEENLIGYSVRLGIRYYASDYSYMQEGFYFGLNARYQAYKSDFISIEDIDYTEPNNSNNIDFRLHVGYLYTWEENFFIEPYVAFGLRNRTYQEISYDEVSNVYNTTKETKVNPILSLGFKLGISF